MNDPRALLEAGRALHAQGRLQEAEQRYRAAAALAPGHPIIVQHLGMVFLDTGRAGEAAEMFKAVVAAAPQLAIAHLGLGNALNALGRSAEALDAFNTVRRLEPKNAAGPFGAGHALQSLGRIAEARRAFEDAVALAPDVPPFHYPLAMIARFTENDPRLPALEALAARTSMFPEPMTVDLYFALGKAFDDLGRYTAAFEYYAKGNAIRRKLIRYDVGPEQQMLSALARSFVPDLFAAGRVEGDLAPEPVFVVGMPRCGSSLVEQILASHPDVYGAGELNVLPQLLDDGLAGRDFPLGIAGLAPGMLARLGSRYAIAVRRLAEEAKRPGVKRIVDKALANFRLVGLIHLALPNARIIHVRRDPRDTCLSCYFNLFTQGVNFAYDLTELGRYYSAYDGMMAHWRAVLPPGTMLEVDYEALVENLEGQTRRMLDYCGLPFDARCLDFHLTKRVVHTVSAGQVHQPVYRRSVGRWRPYAEFLGPLFDALPRTGS